MLVGPTGGGKTANYRSLAGAMSLLNTQGSTVYEKVMSSIYFPSKISLCGNKTCRECTEAVILWVQFSTCGHR